MESAKFMCNFCEETSDTFESILSHACDSHPHQTLKLKSLELNIETGRIGYRTHNFGIIPSDISKRGQKIIEKNNEPGNLAIRVITTNRGTGVSDSYILKSPLAKKSKPLYKDDYGNGNKSDIQYENMETDKDDNEVACGDLKNECIDLIPETIENLKKHGHYHLWKKFNELVAENKFPMDNIAYLLFLDIVKWYSNENTVTMRYDETVSRFWRIGYKLFHGKFLRFMSGPKNQGALISGEALKGNFSPQTSKINFAVPRQKVTESMSSVLPAKEIQPGIIEHLLTKFAEKSKPEETFKICLDGKKINSSVTGVLGDVDLFGFESSPTLVEKKKRLEDEIVMVNEINRKIDSLQLDTPLCTLLPSIAEPICRSLQILIGKLSCRLKDFRQLKATREASLNKFKQLAGKDWKKSSMCNVISAISTQIYDIQITIKELLNLIDKLGYACSILNKNDKNFSQTSIVDLKTQVNYIHLNEIQDHRFSENDSRLLKQRTDQWFELRKQAVVTGSTLNASLGLETLKKQQEHFDQIRFGKEKASPSAETLEKMKHGTDNEINAIASLTGKILPVFYPNLSYVEEGCIKVDVGDLKMIVSPDGSCKDRSTHETKMAIEIKCPAPTGDMYKLPVFYAIPRYYVPQILSEMYSLQSDELLFISYSHESTTVIKATFCQTLWQAMGNELEEIYRSDASRPKKKSPQISVLKSMIDNYLETKVEFIAEISSVKARQCEGRVSLINDPFCVHAAEQATSFVFDTTIASLKQYMHESKVLFETSYKLNRLRASEFLGFMISNLDRNFTDDSLHSVPIAFGLKGYSLPTSTLRKMLEYVLLRCAEKGLYAPVVSFDGQWYRIVVRDRNELPLTLFQLQKDVYTEVMKMSPGQLLSYFITRNVLQCESVQEMKSLVEISKPLTAIIIGKKFSCGSIHISTKIINMIKTWNESKKKVKDRNANPQAQDNDSVNDNTDILSSLPNEIVDALQEETIHDIMNIETVSRDDKAKTNTVEKENVLNIADALRIAEESELNIAVPSVLDEQVGQARILTDEDILKMLESVKLGTKSKKNWNISVKEFLLKFCDAKTMDKSFTKYELLDSLNPVLGKLAANGKKISVSSSKKTIIDKLSEVLGDGSLLPDTAVRKKSPKSLIHLARVATSRLPKVILGSIYAEQVYEDKLKDWYHRNPFGSFVNIESLENRGTWYSMPEYNSVTGNYLFMVLDTYHQLCGLRRLVCQKGIPSKGIKRSSFIEIAENCKTNNCGLNLAMVDDLIDKQSAEFACATFSDKVSTALDDIGAHKEARFCRLVNNWYRAEDQPGIPAKQRCQYRLDFKEWLLDGVSFSQFPPYGSYVNDIPIVLFEGLLTNIERKIQLFTFTKSGSYNVRSVGSLDIENFFGTFQDLDPKGTGVLNPDDIPTAISIAAELMDAKLDANRGFFLNTTASKIYPTKPLDVIPNAADVPSASVVDAESMDIWRDLTVISPKDHPFDFESRCRGKQKRKSSGVSLPMAPARGCQPVRQFHRRDESKILPHVRRGLKLEDIECTK